MCCRHCVEYMGVTCQTIAVSTREFVVLMM